MLFLFLINITWQSLMAAGKYTNHRMGTYMKQVEPNLSRRMYTCKPN